MALCLCCAINPAHGDDASQQAPDRQKFEAVHEQALLHCAVMLYNPDLETAGTGILFEGGKYFATNFHVLGFGLNSEKDRNDYRRVSIVAAFGPLALEPLWTQEHAWNQDVIVIRTSIHDLEDRKAPPPGYGVERYVRFADLKAGQKLWTLGNRLGRAWTLSEGRVELLYDDPLGMDLTDVDQMDLYKTGSHKYERLIFAEDTLLDSGNSGGPVVDEYGRLAGMAFAKARGRSVVIPVEYLFSAINLSEPSTAKIR